MGTAKMMNWLISRQTQRILGLLLIFDKILFEVSRSGLKCVCVCVYIQREMAGSEERQRINQLLKAYT